MHLFNDVDKALMVDSFNFLVPTSDPKMVLKRAVVCLWEGIHALYTASRK